MKLLRLIIISVLILLVAWLIQSSSDENQSPLAHPSALPRASITRFQGEAERSIAKDGTGSAESPVVRPAALPRVRGGSHAEPSVPGQGVLGDWIVDAEPTPAPTASVTPSAVPTPTLPKVIAYEPAFDAVLGDLHKPIVITFDTSDQGEPWLRPWSSAVLRSLQIIPLVQGQVTWRDDHALIFTPEPSWTPNTRYEVRLGDHWRTWFRTRGVVESFSPGRGSATSPQTTVAVRFGVAVDRSSIESAFTLSPTVAGRLEWTDNQRVVFEPEGPLDYLTTYYVSFDGELRDAAGQPLPVVPGWSFTTGSALISAKPDRAASVDSAVELRFAAPVDHASVEAALEITPAVAGSFQWQENLLTFAPSDYLDPDTTYYAVLRATAHDLAGRRLLDRDYEWRFTTQSIPHTVSFGYGPNIQLLDADGTRAVQLMSYASRRVMLRLYALNIEQFLDRYTSSFRGVGPYDDKPIKTGDLPLVLAWEQEVDGRDEAAIPASAAPGLYVLEAQSGPGRDQLIVVLSRHVLVLKQAGGQIVTWASTITDHAPAAGMHLRFYDRDGTQVSEGATEGRGLHRALVSLDPEPLLVIGELNGDITVSGLGHEWQDGWGWWGWWENSPSAPDATIYPYTDRPIYRPGQTVHARAVVRRDEDAVYSLPGGTQVVLRLRDARDNVIATRQLAPDEFGAAHADFELADGGTVGTYNLEVSALGETVRQPFLVEAYRKPDYEVTLTPATEHAVAGEPLTLTVQARYFFGPPVIGAKVELVPYVVGYGYWYEEDPAIDYGYVHEKLRRVGHTDVEGRFAVVLPVEVTNDSERQTWNIEATVTDASDLSVSGHTRIFVHRSAYGLSVHTDRYHYRPGEPIPTTLLARDHHGSSQAGVDLTVGLYAWEWKTRDFSRAVVELSVTTGSAGSTEATLQTSEPGWYQLRAEAADSAGGPVEAQSWVWVYDEGSGLWDNGGGSSGELRLSTDRDRYAPGDSVRLLIESPVSGPALLSFERGTTRRETVVQLEGGLNTLDFQLLPEDAPNVHVAIAVWRPTSVEDERWRWQSRPEAELLTARTEILVPADDRRLSVTITPDRAEYAPRDGAVFLVEIRDQAGQPVRAGFSLALVDEAIFALAADRTPDIFDAFYQPRPDLVRTYHSLRPTRWLDGGLGGGGGGADLTGSPRSDFPDTAFWAPGLTTDANGMARVLVPLPDSLTSWRAVVRAVTVDTKAGQATASVTVALPLSIQPVLPRFLVEGDRATLTAVVHNHTGLTQTAQIQLTSTGVELAGVYLAATQPITLPANGTVAVGWPVVATKLGEAGVRMDVALQGDGEGAWHDAVAVPLSIVPRAIPQLDTVATEVEGEWVETIALPDAAIPDVSRWELSFAPSIATGMLDGLEYLIDYPFG